MAKTYVGARLRQLRTERGLSQAALAKTLEISASYLNQIEHDVRPLTVPVLLRISEVFGVDATFFSSQDDTRLIAEMREVALDREMGIEADAQEIAEMVAAHPTLARAMVNLHRRFRNTTAQLAVATEERYSDGSGSGAITMPHRRSATTSTSGRTTCTISTPRPRSWPTASGSTAATWGARSLAA